MIEMAVRTSTRVTLTALLALGALAGCASDGSSVEKGSGDAVVTGFGDDRDQAMANARAHALERCRAQKGDEFIVVDQQLRGPQDSADEAANDRFEGASVDEDSELQAATQEGDGYQATWTIRCR